MKSLKPLLKTLLSITLLIGLSAKFIHANPNLPDSLYQVGMDNYNKREYLKALEAFRLAIPGFMDNGNQEMLAKTYARVGFNLVKLGNEEMAQQYFEKASVIFASLGSNDLLYAIVVGMSGMYEQSNRMLREHIGNPTALNWLGLNMRSLGQLDSALYYHHRALAGKGEKPRYWPYILIGDVLTEQGKYEQAIENYQTALSLVGEKKVIRYNINTSLGNAYLLQGEYQKAVDFLLTTGLPPEASNFEVAKRNYELLQKAYAELNLKKIETNIIFLKMGGLLVVMFLVWFFLRQRSINSNVSGKLSKMYAKYLDLLLKRAIIDIEDERPVDAKEDIVLARELTRKIQEN